MTPTEILDALRLVVDPELGINVVDLGLVYGIDVTGADVRGRMTMTAPGCPLAAWLCEEAAATVRDRVPGVRSVTVELVWDPPWQPTMMSAAARARLRC